MSVQPIRVLQPFFQNTFEERGVLLDFTAPALVGTRMRRGQGNETELLVPNPSGGVGLYVLEWASIQVAAQPTVHDMALFYLVQDIFPLSPAALRQATRMMALEGFAGEAAQQAAQEAEAQDRRRAMSATIYIGDRLADQMLPDRKRAQETSATDFQRVVTTAIRAAGSRLGMDEARVRAELTRLGELFMQVCGMHLPPASRPPGGPAPVMRLLERIQELITSLPRDINQETATRVARDLRASAAATLPCVRAVAQTIARRADQPLELLAQIASQPDGLRRYCERVDWMLDGWEQICLRWGLLEDQTKCTGFLLEIAPLVPSVPKQSAEWSGLPMAFDLLSGGGGEEEPKSRKIVDPPSKTLNKIARLEAMHGRVAGAPAMAPPS